MSRVSNLLKIKPHEAENETETSLIKAFELLKPSLKPPFSLAILTPTEYLNLNQAILYGVLTEPQFAKTHFTHLCGIITDGYRFFTSLVLKMVFELYPKLLDEVRIQVLWVTRRMVEVEGVGVDGLLVCLMRQISGWDFSDGNLWLSMELVSIVGDNWEWFLEDHLLFTSFVFTYLRLLADHCKLSGHDKFEGLRKMEIDFCVRALRMHFSLCLRIGRDLVRLLQDLVHIPEFRDVWKDLLLSPGNFNVLMFTDISQLYYTRTSSRYLLLRITPEMETKLRFLLTHARWGTQHRYQEWFYRKYLCGVGGDSIISDIVRFICCAHHPSNDIIQSDVVPRWAIIGWLLKCCRNNQVESSIKLALFFDWLFFDERVDNIMNIEPGMLLMVNSIPKYIDMTRSLLEFLLLLAENYDVRRKDILFHGVSTAFGVLVRKGVVQSLEVFTSCDSLSPLIKARISKIILKSRSDDSEKTRTDQLPHFSLPAVNLDTSIASCSMQDATPKQDSM